ncbi:hypothetical protein GmHk_14G041126 [Glycine max]|nr:hypothetical protein GmHk_14G041126 [Glycine max]
MEAWGSLVDCPSKQEFDNCLMKFEITNKVMHLDNKTINRYENYKYILVLGFRHKWIKIIVIVCLFVFFKCKVESMHWALKRLLQNSLGDLYSVWKVMNNTITLQHTKIKASFETSTHVVGHVFKVTLYKKLHCMVSRYALNQIAAEFEPVNYAGIDSSRCGCIMKTTYGLPCACELARYVVGSILLDTIHMF